MIKKVNGVLAAVIILVSIVAGGRYYWAHRENSRFYSFAQTKSVGEQAPAAVSTGEVVIKEDHPGAEETSQPLQQDFKSSEPTGKGKKFTFAAVGDSEKYSDTGYAKEFEAALLQMKKYNPALLLLSGNVVAATSSDPEENKKRITFFKNLVDSQFSKYHIAFGSQDIGCGDACINLWQNIFFNRNMEEKPTNRLYFSFDYYNTHFVLLSSDYPLKQSVDDEQLDWLAKDLAGTTMENKIVVVHVPPVNFFSKSAQECHDMSCNLEMRDKLLEILEGGKVDVVLSAHENAFDHKVVGNIDYVLVGSLGERSRFPEALKRDIYSVFLIDGKDIVLQGYDLKGALVREIKLK